MIGAFQADNLKSSHTVSGEIPRKPWLGPSSLSTGSSSRSFLLAPWGWRLRGVSRNAYSLPTPGGLCGLSPAMVLLYLLTYLGEGSQLVSWASVCCCQSHPTRTLSGGGWPQSKCPCLSTSDGPSTENKCGEVFFLISAGSPIKTQRSPWILSFGCPAEIWWEKCSFHGSWLSCHIPNIQALVWGKKKVTIPLGTRRVSPVALSIVSSPVSPVVESSFSPQAALVTGGPIQS